ncbi:uncharacterized protein PRCAT00002286001 [Priceomyces carsonii]|uniref:uncharacterized protein n=1 Tax=Priceomyces carsonii TaxID=28549 RepID=UPI002EDB4DF3|nr:unnamed protein product [Priceomyces carsonii]
MNNGHIDQETQDIEGDIIALRSEIEELKKTQENLLNEVRLLDVEGAHESTEHQKEQEYNVDEIEAIPSVSQHDRFDESISKFFETLNEGKKKPVNKLKLEALERAKKLVDLKESILYENIFRFAGITAFPLNEYMFGDDDRIMGLRFDILSHFHKKYVTPHYIIIKKIPYMLKDEQIITKWRVYKHTLPVYVPLAQFESSLLQDDQDNGVYDLAKNVRTFLTKLQYKHDVLNLIGVSFKEVQKIEKDLQCQSVTILLHARRSGLLGYLKISLNCSIDFIEEADIRIETGYEHLKEQILTGEAMLLNCTFNDLIDNLHKLIQYFSEQSIL